MLKKQRLEIKLSIMRSLLRFKRFPVESSLLIFSDPRSGSTWLMEVLGHIKNTTLNWEPLHQNEGVIPENKKWLYRLDISDTNEHQTDKADFEDILTMKRSTEWTLKYASIKQIWHANRVLTKFVRANLVLPWLCEKFKFTYRPILLVRHPLSTVLSGLKAFEGNNSFISNDAEFKIPNIANNERFIQYKEYLSFLEPKFERNIALWCINNKPLLEHPDRDRWMLIHYENMVMHPRKTIENILSEYKLDANIDNIEFDKKSSTDFQGDLAKDTEKQLNKYKDLITQAQIDKAQEILDHFKIIHYKADIALPIVN